MDNNNSFFVIINPKSGQGKGLKLWPKIEAQLKPHFKLHSVFTEYAKHESVLAKSALKKGFKQFIILGGDGTLRNFINGVFNQKTVDTSDISFGIIPIGTGNDWIKTHKIPSSTSKAIETIIKGRVKNQDVGKIEYETLKKDPEYFMNIAGVGFDGLVVDLVKNKRQFGSLTYTYGAIKGLFKHRPFDATVIVDDASKPYNNCFILQLGIGKYTGSGMRLTDYKDASDGLFDISIASHFSKWVFITRLRSVFNGKIVHHKDVTSFKTNHIIIRFDNENKPLLQVDGELLEQDNIKVSLLHKAIRFYY